MPIITGRNTLGSAEAPPDLGGVICIGAFDRDAGRLTRVWPDSAETRGSFGAIHDLLTTGGAQLRESLGKDIGPALDFARPIVVGLGDSPSSVVGYAAFLRTSLESGLPGSRELVSKSAQTKDVRPIQRAQQAQQREGGDEPEQACELRSKYGTHGLLVCADGPERLARWGDFLTALALRSGERKSLELEVSPQLLPKVLQASLGIEASDPLLGGTYGDWMQDLDKFAESVSIGDAATDYEFLVNYKTTHALVSLLSAGPPAPGGALPPEFVELPERTLFAFAFRGLDAAKVTPALLSHALASVGEKQASSATSETPTTSLISTILLRGGPIGVAYGVEGPARPAAAARRWKKSELQALGAPAPVAPAKAGVPADVAVPPAAADPRANTWLLLRLENDFERVLLDAAKAGTGPLGTLSQAANSHDGPASIHHFVLERSGEFHLFTTTRGKVALLVASEDEATARSALVQAMHANGGAHRSIFRPPGVKAASGLGFLTPAALVSMMFSSEEDRSALFADPIWLEPAPFRYDVSPGAKGGAVARLDARISHTFLRTWLGYVLQVLGTALGRSRSPAQ